MVNKDKVASYLQILEISLCDVDNAELDAIGLMLLNSFSEEERDSWYGFSVLNGAYYVGSKEELKAIGVISWNPSELSEDVKELHKFFGE